MRFYFMSTSTSAVAMLLFAAVAGCCGVASAESVTATGYLVDKLCLGNCAATTGPEEACAPDGSNVLYDPARHTGWCLLLQVCIDSGFVLMSEMPGEDGKHEVLLDFGNTNGEAQADVVAFAEAGTSGMFPLITVEYDDSATQLVNNDDGQPTTVVTAGGVKISDTWIDSNGAIAEAEDNKSYQVLCEDSSVPDVSKNNACFSSAVIVTEVPSSEMLSVESNGCPDHPNMQGTSGLVDNPNPEQEKEDEGTMAGCCGTGCCGASTCCAGGSCCAGSCCAGSCCAGSCSGGACCSAVEGCCSGAACCSGEEKEEGCDGGSVVAPTAVEPPFLLRRYLQQCSAGCCSAGPTEPAAAAGSVLQLLEGMEMVVSADAAAGTASFEVTFDENGYVALGTGTQMLGSTAVIGLPRSATPVQLYSLNALSPDGIVAVDDDQQILQDVSLAQEGGGGPTTLKFTVPLETEPFFVSADAETNFIFARGTDNSLKYHGVNRGTIAYNVVGSGETPTAADGEVDTPGCSAGCCSASCGAKCDGGCCSAAGCCSAGCGAGCGAKCDGGCDSGCGAKCGGCGGGGCCGSKCGASCGGCCSTTSKNGDGHGSSIGAYSPTYQHYRMLIPTDPGQPGEAKYFTGIRGDDVVGIMTNGVLLDSHKATWSYDSCNGHSDKKHQYHYHIPPKCFLESVGVEEYPEETFWWKDANQVRAYADMASQWPATGEPSPVVGFALDGYPIFGPYDGAGSLQRGKEFGGDVDECNGKVDENGNYGYYLTVDPPFAPPCLRGEKKGVFSYYATELACPKEGTPKTTVLDAGAAEDCATFADCAQAAEEAAATTSDGTGPASIALALAAVSVAIIGQF